MSSAERYVPHYTVDDYNFWEGDWELWNGTAVSMTPSPFGDHSNTLANIVYVLKRSIEESNCTAAVLPEIDWIVAEDTVLRPDVTVVCGPPPKRHVESPPAIAVEILSEATRTRDLTFKRNIYQEQKIQWYLILDPEDRSIIALKLNSVGEYEETSFGDSIQMDICGSCELQVDVSRLFE